MSDGRWFSAKLRFAILVEPNGGDTMNDRLFLLKAEDFALAFDRAIAIGLAAQREYRNADGQRVQWRLVQVISLDMIQSEDLEGQEVYSEPIHLSQEGVIPFETLFSPESSIPFQTI